jgi:Secretion system C-terminal sorting domain/Fibronectin type III domain
MCLTPDSLRAYDFTNTSASLTWKKVAGALNYEVIITQITTQTAAPLQQILKNITNNKVLATNLLPNTQYSFTVRANCTNDAASQASAPWLFKTKSDNATVPCGEIKDLKYSFDKDSAVVLNWIPVAGVKDYAVIVTNPKGVVDSFNTTLVTATIKKLAVNTLYKIKLKANCPTGAYSAVILSLTVKSKTPPPPACGNIKDLKYTFNKDSSIVLNWLASPNAKAYSVVVTNEKGVKLDSIYTTSLSATVKKLAVNTSHKIKISSICSSGTASTTLTLLIKANVPVVTCGEIKGFKYFFEKDSTINLSWIAYAGVTNYQVFVFDEKGKQVDSIYTLKSNVILKKFPVNKEYKIRVKGTCPNGTSSSTLTLLVKSVTVEVGCGQVKEIKYTFAADSSVTITWVANPNVKAYSVLVENYKGKIDSIYTTKPTVTLKKLAVNVLHKIKFMTICDAGKGQMNTYYITIPSKLPTSTCAEVKGLKVTPTDSCAYLSWEPLVGIKGYEVSVVSETGAIQLLFSTTNTFKLSKLTKGGQYKVRVRSVCQSGGNGEWTSPLNFIALSSVTTNKTLITSLYPNPVIDEINVKVIDTNEFVNIFIFDVAGKMVKNVGSIGGGVKTINLSQLFPGNYFIKVVVGANAENKTFILSGK